MRIGSWIGLLAAATFLAFIPGCGDFWQAPSNTADSFTLSANPTSVAIASGSASGTSTITVTPGSSLTGTVTLSCTVTTALTSPFQPGDLRTQCIFADLQQCNGANLHANRNLNQFDDQRNL